MRIILLSILGCLLIQFTSGRSDGRWVRFYDTTSRTVGCKDFTGTIKIPSTYETYFTRDDTLPNIMAIHEIGSSDRPHYLLKDGRKVGYDSVYVFDWEVDCESEGKIIFASYKTDRVGFLDKNGRVIIPAIYNYVSPFRNGMSRVCINAKRKCWDEEMTDSIQCEHLGWEGGQLLLINDKNEILVDSFYLDISNIDWYTLKINDPNIDTNLYVSIKGRNSITYSYIDLQKEFTTWYYSVFIPAIYSGKEQVRKIMFHDVEFWKENVGWTSLPRDQFLETFPDAFSKERFELNEMKKLVLHQEPGWLFFTRNKLYLKYRGACGRYNTSKYPSFDAMMTYYQKNSSALSNETEYYKKYQFQYQEHFSFLRTEEGYKLVQVSVKN